MLNGVAPILIFNFIKKKDNSAGRFLSGIPVIGSSVASAFTGGLPIPIYLDERLTGIYVDSESRSLDIHTEAKAKYVGGPPDVSQRAVDSSVTVNLFALKDSPALTVLLAFSDMIFSSVVSKEYNVSYLNGPTLIFGGLLNSFTTNTGIDDDLVRIAMTISKANQETTKPKVIVPEIGKSTGTLPAGGL